MWNNVRKVLKKEYFIREIVTLFIMVISMLGFVLYESLAIFAGSVEKANVASITTGTIDFTITSEDTSYSSSTKQITVAAGVTKYIIFTITNDTSVAAKYKLYYKPISPTTLPSGASVNLAYTSLNPAEAPLESGASTKVKAVITNNSTSSITVEIGLEGGYANNSVTLSSGNSSLALETINSSTLAVKDFAYTGAVQTYTVPEDGEYKLEVWGAQGGYRSSSTYAGKGGYSYGTVSLTKGTILYIYSGGSGNTGGTSGGFNGGGKRSTYNGGGGASDIRIGQDSLYARVIVAGGGGSDGATAKTGMYGGGETGGSTTANYGTGGYGGTQTGNTWLTDTQSTTTTASTDAYAGFGFGGNGVTRSSGYGGAGGGGFYGGSGSYPDGSGDDDRGGGGGSGYVYTSSTASNYPSGCLLTSTYYLTDAATVAGNTSFTSPTGTSETGHTGDGYARITPLGYEDESGANTPKLAEGLIPVVYNSSKDVWIKANIAQDWYDYDNQIWANAVTTSDSTYRTATAGTEIPMSSINSMWVWIPRYKYKITSNIGSSSNVTSPPQIDVVFESGTGTTGTALASCSITSTSCYYTHPAFRNGSSVYKTTAYDQGGWDRELEGIWVGKFETSGSATTPTIKPDVTSLRQQNVSTQFTTSLKFAGGTMDTSTGVVTFAGNTTYGLTSNADSHMMKNTEWGAVAYLSQSKYGKYGNINYTGANKEIYKNNSSSYYTGRSGGAAGGSTPINETYADQTSTTQYNTYGFYTYNDYLLTYGTNTKGSRVLGKGTGASTTGTIYGVYDMSGGASEYTMENWAGIVGSSGFSSFPTSKYYEKYTGTSSSTITSAKSIKGDATYETMRWYSDNASFANTDYPWATRGGDYSSTSTAGVFNSNGYSAGNAYNSFRSTLIP